MRWTIAILTIPERKTEFTRIMGILRHQIIDQDIEVLVAGQDWGIPEKRQWCLDNAEGEYFNFIDDDDLIAHDYVDSIYPLLDGVDYVGFKQQYYFNGRKGFIAHHSLEYQQDFGDDTGYHRGVSHLNPIRTEIARQGSFVEGFGEELCEDYRWAQQVSPNSQYFIDKVLYFYFDQGD